MRLPDVNLFLYAHDPESARHAGARSWLEARFSSPETVGLTWMTVTSFLRISTSRRVFRDPLMPRDASSIVDGWLARPNVVVLEPTHRHWVVLRGLIEHVGTAGNLVTDAHLAALAIEHGATLESADHDFGRFPGLRWEDPLMVSPPRRPTQSRRR